LAGLLIQQTSQWDINPMDIKYASEHVERYSPTNR
jgi:hypothetical protein